MKFVAPAVLVVPAIRPNTSPGESTCRRSSSCSANSAMSAADSFAGQRSGVTPHSKFMRLHTASIGVKA